MQISSEQAAKGNSGFGKRDRIIDLGNNTSKKNRVLRIPFFRERPIAADT